MSEQVFILGQIGKAVYEQAGRYYVVGLEDEREAESGLRRGPVECRAGEAAFFFDVCREYSVIEGNNVSLDTIRETLEFSSQAHSALTMSLSGLNSELSPESRTLAVEAAEELLQAAPVRAFVRARLLARLLPETADMDGALVYAADAAALAVFALYEEVRQSQEAVKLILEAWGEVAVKSFPYSPEEAAEVEKILIESGVFAEMAAAATAGETDRLGSIVVTYGMKPELRKALPPPRGTQLINAVRMGLQERVNAAPLKAADARREEMEGDGETAELEGVAATQADAHGSGILRELIAAFDKRDRSWRPSRGYEVEERINNQLEAIGKHINRGDHVRANMFLYGLLKFQLEHSRKEHVAMSLCALAKIALDANALEMATDLVGYAFALDVKDAAIWNTQAEIFKARGDFDAAIAVYEQTMQRFPDDVVACNGYAEALKARGDFDAAIEVYRQTMQRFPDDDFARTGYAEALKAKGDFDAAIKVYRQTMQRFPDNVVARTGYAEALKAKGDFDAAIKVYEQTMQRFPDDVVARTGYAEALKAKGDFDAAIQAFEQTIQRFPDNAVVRAGYAEALKAKGDFDAAIRAFEQTMQRFPNNVVARTGYAEALKAKGDFDAAIQAFEQTMQRFPDNVVARTGYAEALKAKGDFDAAIKVYEQTMQRFPDDVVVRTGYASLWVIMKNFRKAESLLTYLSGIQPVTREHWIGHHILAMSYLKRGETDEAIRRLEYGLKNTQWSDSRNYFATALGVARIRRKEFKRAIEILEDNVVSLDVFQRQKRLALIAHSKAELGQKSVAMDTLAQITNVGIPLVFVLKIDLTRRFDLDPLDPQSLSEAEIMDLEIKIADAEDQLALTA